MYRQVVEAGAEAIVSVHVGADVSGTVNAARLAAELVDIPVFVVDSGTASFGVTACLWRAADVLAAGGTAPEAAAAAGAVAPAIGTSFILQGLEFARGTRGHGRHGRLVHQFGCLPRLGRRRAVLLLVWDFLLALFYF